MVNIVIFKKRRIWGMSSPEPTQMLEKLVLPILGLVGRKPTYKLSFPQALSLTTAAVASICFNKVITTMVIRPLDALT